MPRYHDVSGNDITVYLDIRVDKAKGFDVAIPLEELLKGIEAKWRPIATAMDFRLIIAPAKSPGMDEDYPSPRGTALFENATPSDRILYHNNVLVPSSAAVKFFKLKIGLKDSVRKETQSARISYVDYINGNGYIYSQAKFPRVDLRDIAHELGHILGLVDRYYDAIVWDSRKAVDRSCWQVMQRKWIVAGQDHRIPIDVNSTETRKLPRYADRFSLLMHKNAMPKDKDGKPLDPDYNPSNNLMSSSKPLITAYQLGLIGIKDGQAQTPAAEPIINKSNWIAVLGDDANPPYKPFYAWDGGRGLMFYPDNDDTKTPESYPCWNGKERGRDAQGKIVRPELITVARGKKYTFIRIFPDKKYKRNKRLQFPISIDSRNEFCYCKRLLADLQRK